VRDIEIVIKESLQVVGGSVIAVFFIVIDTRDGWNFYDSRLEWR
jgi:hypothetical protein